MMIFKHFSTSQKKTSVAFAACMLLALFLQAGPQSAMLADKMASDREPLRPISNSDDKTLSPYFFIKGEEAGADQLPLKHTEADVNIAGVIADVKITQQYKNSGTQPIEAIYVFPASTRAAVYSMRMTIGERVIEAEIQEKAKARENYEKAKQEGKSASLLEQHRPNVFQMNVANIMPGDEIKVEMSYTELLVPEEGVYEFVYPTVVGPRFSDQPVATASKDQLWVANPYLEEGEAAPYTFHINTNIRAGMPIQAAKCLTHDVDLKFTGPAMAKMSLKESEKYGGDRDFIVQYRLSGQKVESGLLLYEGEKENYFLLMMQPPKRGVATTIPPREYIFIVDVSGSMYGFPLNVSKTLLKDLIGNLRPTDRFNVMFFSGGNHVMAEQSMPATAANINKAIQMIDGQRGGGGTQLLPAMQRALNMPGTENFSRSFIVATDGYVSVEPQTFDLIRNNLNQANVFAFGIGSSVNRHIIEGMANVGMGEPFIVTNQTEAGPNADKLRKYVQDPVLTNIKVKFDGMEVYDMEPVSIPDVMADRPVILFGKYKGKPSGKVRLEGLTGGQPYEQVIDVAGVAPEQKNSALRYLWARHKIKILGDYQNLRADDQRVKEITQLGLDYNLLTAYTSFIAVDSEVRNATGNVTSVNQPLPLPQGVSNHAIGQPAGGASSYNYYAPAPPAMKMASPEMIELADVEEDVVAFDRIAPLEVLPDPKPEPEVFMIVEQMPEFATGQQQMMEFIKHNMQYPKQAKESQIEGLVVLQFTVNVDGSISDIKVLKSPDDQLSQEAIRIVKKMPKWKPGMQRGKAVPVKMNLPVRFKLTQ